jgi:hypothetical protein
VLARPRGNQAARRQIAKPHAAAAAATAAVTDAGRKGHSSGPICAEQTDRDRYKLNDNAASRGPRTAATLRYSGQRPSATSKGGGGRDRDAIGYSYQSMFVFVVLRINLCFGARLRRSVKGKSGDRRIRRPAAQASERRRAMNKSRSPVDIRRH